MSYYLRKISLPKWQSNIDKETANFTADAITGCTRTSKNTLSVWESPTIDFDHKSVSYLIAALATTMDRPDVIDLVWLEKAWLEQNDIKIVETLGQSKIESVNHYHRDLSELTHRTLGIVASHIVSQIGNEVNFKRITKSEVISHVRIASAEANLFSFDDLSDGWQKFRP